MEQKEFTINGKQIIVKKLPLKKYADLLGAIQELPNHLNLIQGKGNDEIIKALPTLITTSYPDVVRIMKIVSNLEDEDIDKMDLYDFISIVEATYEVNRLGEVFQKVKNMGARPTPSQVMS